MTVRIHAARLRSKATHLAFLTVKPPAPPWCGLTFENYAGRGDTVVVLRPSTTGIQGGRRSATHRECQCSQNEPRYENGDSFVSALSDFHRFGNALTPSGTCLSAVEKRHRTSLLDSYLKPNTYLMFGRLLLYPALLLIFRPKRYPN